jgi:type I restriction enzyme S subunit
MSRVPLQELLDLSDSGVWGDEDTENGISVLRSTNFNKNGTLDFTKLTFRVIEERKRAAKILQEGDILLEKSGGGPQQPVGRVCLYRGHALQHSFGNFIARLRPKANILSEFLFYFLWHFHSTGKTSHYQKQTTGIRNLEYKRFLTIEVPVPPIPEQRRIVDILSRAEGIVRLRREAEKKAAELIPSLFLNMFGDPVTNPKGWPVDKLDAVAKIISGATKGRRFDPSEAIELPYMRVANVKDGHLDLTEIKTIAVKRGEVEKYRLLPGDLLMTEGGDPDKLGRGALWSGEIETCLHQNHIFKVRADRSILLPEYLCELVGSRYGKAYFLRVAKKTTGIATINRTQLGGFPVVVPPLDRQQEFGEKLDAVRSIQSQQSAATAKAKATFDALLAQTFNNQGN